jgi:PAS domain S-box-containing protein
MTKKDLEKRVKELEIELSNTNSSKAVEVTEQVRVRIKVEESEQHFRSLAENIPLNVFIIEPTAEANISYLNKHWLDYTGQTLEEAVGRAWEGSIHPDDVQPIMDVYVPAYEKRQPYVLPNIRIRRYDGQYRWFTVQANPRYLPNGEFIGYLGFGFDNHERKLAEDALKESETFNRTVLENSPDCVKIIDTAGRIKYMNINGLCNMEIDDFDTIKNKLWGELWGGENKQTVLDAVDKAMSGEVAQFQAMRLTAKGTPKWWDVVVSPVHEAGSNKVTKIIAVSRDITEQIKAQNLLEYSKALLVAHNEASFDGILLVDAKGKIISYNKRFVAIWNMPQHIVDAKDDEAALSFAMTQLVNPQQFIEKVNYLYAHPTETCTDILDYKNGKIVERHGYPVVADDGSYYAWSWTFRDITQQKIVEKELAFQNAEKEKRADELIIANKELQAAKTEVENAIISAKETLKAKQQFLSNMSHEIRTPLNSIIGFTNVLLKNGLSEQQDDYVQAIKTSSDSLNVLINDILDLAKVDAGKMTFVTEPFDMRQSIKSILHSFDLKLKEKNLELVREYDSKIPPIVLGDSVRLNQIILNLMSNAIKFTHKGKITLSVKIQSEEGEKTFIEFAVTDSGIGIAADKIDSIFNLFEQAEITTSNSYGGTGLGLAIVKQLIEFQGGTIGVSSKIGVGSTFSFTLPFGKTDKAIVEEKEILKLDSTIKALRILVAEDIVLNQLLIKIILSDFGFAHDVVDNGKIAVEKLKTHTYDIILMDMQMPQMNGFEATEYIRKTMKSKIPIIALTADVTTVDIAKCKAFGMDDYISKPIDENQLYNKIVALVKRNNNY